MSYTIKKTITVEYIDHEARLEKSGNSYRAVAHPVTRHKDIDVNVHVNTEPFDHSVDRSVDSIGDLTEAIVGFKTANVMAKKANEQAIVEHVASGFLGMIEQNINLQHAGMAADMQALASELTQQCKELGHKHDVMHKDFNRIKSRYIGLFEAINKEFKNRIQALIKPCFDFVSQVKTEQDRRAGSNLLSMATIGGKESDSARIAIQASKMKHNAASLINASRNFIDENRSLNRAVSTFAIDGNLCETYYAPAVIMAEHNNTDNDATKVFLNPICNVGESVENLIMQQCDTLNTKPISPDAQNCITTYFNQKLDELDDGSVQIRRIIMKMKALFEQNAMSSFS